MTHPKYKTASIIADNQPAGKIVKSLSVFIGGMVGATLFCLGAYALTVDRLIDQSSLPGTYKWFLLKEIPGPRVIFESGSNSHHAIDTTAVGEALGRTAINIADNGGYALEDKITRLETYARPGDVIVMPLEWSYYDREKLTDGYVDSLFGSNFEYYRSMPLVERLKRALSLPPSTVLSELVEPTSASKRSTESPAQNLFISALTQPTGHQSRPASTGPGAGVAEQSCDDYVLGTAPARQKLSLGDNIKPALARLRKLKAQGIDIHFAWPVLAGDGCLTASQYVEGFRTEIEDAVTDAGFEFLGTPSQSLYGQTYQDDTPYHVVASGTDVHTQKIIGFLKAQGYATEGEPLNITDFARHRLLELELAASVLPGQAPSQQKPLKVGQILALDDPEARHQVEFSAGWWGFEPYGRWMRDNRAMFRVTLPSNLPEDTVLNIYGITKAGQPEFVNLSVDGKLISSGMFGKHVALSIPLTDLPSGKAISIFVDLPESGQPQSPRELGENDDPRSMTLLFQRIEFTTELETLNPDIPKLMQSAASQADTDDQTQVAFASASKQAKTNNRNSSSKTHEALSVKHSQVDYGDGWWAQETDGRWMRDEEASFKVRLPLAVTTDRFEGYTIELMGVFFSERPQTVDILIDGQNVGTAKVTETGIEAFTFKTTENTEEVEVTLKFSIPKVQSPKDLGLSADERILTFFLRSTIIRLA